MNARFPSNLLVGTSSWSSPDCVGTFYPDSIEPADMISYHAIEQPTVKIDSTWYRMPSRKLVETWKSRTLDGFVFSAKVPKVISQDKYMENCEADLKEFIPLREHYLNY